MQSAKKLTVSGYTPEDESRAELAPSGKRQSSCRGTLVPEYFTSLVTGCLQQVVQTKARPPVTSKKKSKEGLPKSEAPKVKKLTPDDQVYVTEYQEKGGGDNGMIHLIGAPSLETSEEVIGAGTNAKVYGGVLNGNIQVVLKLQMKTDATRNKEICREASICAYMNKCCKHSPLFYGVAIDTNPKNAGYNEMIIVSDYVGRYLFSSLISNVGNTKTALVLLLKLLECIECHRRHCINLKDIKGENFLLCQDEFVFVDYGCEDIHDELCVDIHIKAQFRTTISRFLSMNESKVMPEVKGMFEKLREIIQKNGDGAEPEKLIQLLANAITTELDLEIKRQLAYDRKEPAEEFATNHVESALQ